MLCRTGRGTEEGATSSSYNRRRKRVKSRENLEQAASKRQKQVLGIIEGIYSKVQYLGRKKELGKYKRGN